MKAAASISKPHSLGRALSLAGAALLTLLLVASPAVAQVGLIEDTVKDTSDSVGGTVGDTVKDTGGTVGDTTGTVGGTVGDTVTDTGGTVGDTVGGPAGDTIKDTTGSVGGTVKDISGTVGGTVKDTSSDVGKSIDGTTETVLGDGKTGDKEHGAQKDGVKDGKKDGKKHRSTDGRTKVGGSIVFGEGAFGFGTRTPEISLGGIESAREIAGGQAAAFAPQPLDLGALAEAAVEAAKRFAFPILLSILVVAFMMVQDRVDRKDPKLALAAVDTDQEWLSFA